MITGLQKMTEENLQTLNNQVANCWKLLVSWEKESNYPSFGKHLKSALAGFFLIVFGLIILSRENDRIKPGTTVIRDKILGMEARYFLVYLNGMLLYLSLLVIMEDV